MLAELTGVVGAGGGPGRMGSSRSSPMLRDMDAQDRTTPTAFDQSGPSELSIRWADGQAFLYPVRALRLACGCAHCVDEWTGEYQLDPATVPQDVHPIRMESVGRYAVQIHWSDGHDTGIYTFERLRALGESGVDQRPS
jgi:ATP-binding protein involved in chromosome partitioning